MQRILTLCLFLLSVHSLALSCSCVYSSGCPGLAGPKDPVFRGTVPGVTDVPRMAGFAFLSSRKVRMQVNESFGGISSDLKEVDFFTGRGGGDCGVAFRILRQRRAGEQVPSRAGRIARIDRNLEGRLGTHRSKPLANTLVRLKTDGKTYEAKTDAEGIYAFYTLRSGKYELAPDVPAGTTLSWYIGSDNPLPPFDLHAGACEERNIEVFARGSIQGRVLHSVDQPLPEADRP